MIAKDVVHTFTRNWLRAARRGHGDDRRLGDHRLSRAGPARLPWRPVPRHPGLRRRCRPSWSSASCSSRSATSWRGGDGARTRSSGSRPPRPLVIDFSKPVVRATALFVLVMTTVNIAILAAGTYKAVEVMDSTEFCGTTCHVMKPELTAYSRSPHAHVACVNCHIGPGAGLVRAVEAVGHAPAVRGRLQHLQPADRDAGARPAAGARDLRAVPLAGALHRRPAQDPDQLHRRREDRGAQDRTAHEHRRHQGRQAGRHPLARRA